MMMAEDSDLLDGQLNEPDKLPSERLPPVGATSSPDAGNASEQSIAADNVSDTLKNLEAERDVLYNNLMSLTSHFAQVQFRLKQVVQAPEDDRTQLLEDLDSLAFKPLPDLQECSELLRPGSSATSEESRLSKQREALEQVRAQLEELEKFAYESGVGDEPTSVALAKQRLVMRELEEKLQLNLKDFHNMSTEELKQLVDGAVAKITNPQKVKEKIVEQLKTQVSDLERFIKYMQHARLVDPTGGAGSGAPKHYSYERPHAYNEDRNTLIHMMKRSLVLTQVFLLSQLGCNSRDFEKNLLKRTDKGNHWGDLRARLELSIERVMQLSAASESDPSSRSTRASMCSWTYDDPDGRYDPPDLVDAVRKDLATALRDLVQHGLVEFSDSRSLLPFGCFPSRSQQSGSEAFLHAWQLLLKYYEYKHGREYVESPMMQLAEAFDLDVVGSRAITPKQQLLAAIYHIQTIHKSSRKGDDRYWKAFISYALNEKQLSVWLRLVFNTVKLVDYYYQPWSYVARTRFSDACSSLDRLSEIHFFLPYENAAKYRETPDAY